MCQEPCSYTTDAGQSLSSFTFNVTRIQSVKDPFYQTEAVLDDAQLSKTTSGYMTVIFNIIDRMPCLAPTLDNDDTLFALVIKPGLYLHHVKVTVASGSL